MKFRIVTLSVCYFLLLFQSPNIKYGAISTSSLGEKVLSANHSDPSRQTSGSEQASPKSNPAEGIYLSFWTWAWSITWIKGIVETLWSDFRLLLLTNMADPASRMQKGNILDEFPKNMVENQKGFSSESLSCYSGTS